MGLKYGLLAALTLVLASALVWDRLHPAEGRGAREPGPDPGDTIRVIVGGDPIPDPAPPRPAPGATPAGPHAPPPAAEPAAAAEPGPPPPPAPVLEATWTVAPGDTLGEIAQKALGTSRRAAALARHNGMDLDAVLRVGTVLRIPGGGRPAAAPASAPASGESASAPSTPPPAEAPARTHRVRPGDTLYSLSRRYYGDGARWRRIAEANGIDEADGLRVGAELRIP